MRITTAHPAIAHPRMRIELLKLLLTDASYTDLLVDLYGALLATGGDAEEHRAAMERAYPHAYFAWKRTASGPLV